MLSTNEGNKTWGTFTECIDNMPTHSKKPIQHHKTQILTPASGPHGVAWLSPVIWRCKVRGERAPGTSWPQLCSPHSPTDGRASYSVSSHILYTHVKKTLAATAWYWASFCRNNQVFRGIWVAHFAVLMDSSSQNYELVPK